MRVLMLTMMGMVVLGAWAGDRRVAVEGQTVILHDDHTWEVAPGPAPASGEKIELTKPMGKLKTLTGGDGAYQVSFDPSVWKTIVISNPSAEYQFSNKDSSAWGMVIYEGLDYGLDALQKMVLANARSVDQGADYDEVTEAVVNGLEGRLVTYHATSQGLKFEFESFLSSSEAGSIQYTFYTLATAFHRLRPAFETMISGYEAPIPQP